MPTTPPTPLDEVHLGDVGTLYKLRLTDAGVPFDPTSATTKQIIFKLPSGTVTKGATVLQDGNDFYLTYQVTDPGFHSLPGRVFVQAHLVFPDGSIYSSSVAGADENGQALTIARNLT
jgi:hypothetical protein